ncbi:MAG: type II secretion system F family protein [Desulfobacterales bacterium]|jgi:tight adherence protein C
MFKLAEPTILIPLAGFLALFLLCLGIMQSIRLRSTRKKIVEKIKFGGTATESEQDWQSSDQKRVSFLMRLMNFFGKFGAPTQSEEVDDGHSKRIKFLKAGIRRENAPVIFYGLKYLLVVLLPSIFMIIRLTAFEILSFQLTVAIFVLVALLGYYLPDLWLRQKADKRKERLLKALPDALDLLVICVEAGMGLDEGINRVAKEIKLTSSDLSDEFRFLNLELRAGKNRESALKNLALRTDIEEMRNLVTLLIQADKFGTSVAKTLRVYSDTFRTQRMQKAEELAAKIPVKLVFPLILFIFPSLFVAILGPAVIRIFRNIIMRG